MKKWLLILAVVILCMSTFHVNVYATTITKVDASKVYIKNQKLYVKKTKKLLQKVALYNGKVYKAGVLFTGTLNEKYYEKGQLGTGIYNNYYYKKGVRATGVYKETLYVSGQKNQKLYVYNGKLYNGAKVNTGYVLYNERLYNGTKLATGYALYEGKLYKDSFPNRTVVQYKNVWYVGSEIMTGWIRTKQLGWIEVDAKGVQVIGSVPPPNLKTPTELKEESDALNTDLEPGESAGDTEPDEALLNDAEPNDGLLSDTEPSNASDSDMDMPTEMIDSGMESRKDANDAGTDSPQNVDASDSELPAISWTDELESPQKNEAGI